MAIPGQIFVMTSSDLEGKSKLQFFLVAFNFLTTFQPPNFRMFEKLWLWLEAAEVELK